MLGYALHLAEILLERLLDVRVFLNDVVASRSTRRVYTRLRRRLLVPGGTRGDGGGCKATIMISSCLTPGESDS